MKRRPLGFAAAAAVLAAALPAQAQTWEGDTSNNWTVGSNWVGNIAPASGAATTVTFGTAPTTVSFTPNLDLSRTINTMNLSGPGFTFTGSTLFFDGANAALNVTQPGNTFNNPVQLQSNVALTNSHAITFAGGLAGNGNLTKSGAGRLILTSGPTLNNSFIVLAGTLQLGDGTTGPTVVNSIVNAGSLVFDSPNIDVFGAITGGGPITVEGGANVANASVFPFTHQGSTTIHGRLDVGSAGIDGNGPLLVTPTGQFFVNSDSTIGSLAGSGFVSLFFGTLTTGSDDSSTTFSGNLNGNGGLRKVGAGTFTLSSNSIVTGEIAVEAPGTLRIGNGTTGPGGFFQGAVANGALVIDTNGFFSLSGPLTGTGSLRVEANMNVNHCCSGPLTHQGPTTLIGQLSSGTSPSIDNNAPLLIGPLGRFATGTGTVGSLAGSGNLEVFGPGILTAGGDDSSTTYSGVINGFGDFRKVGAGTLTLATNSWFGGDVTVEAPGTLRIGSGSTGPGSVGALFVNGSLVFDAPSLTLFGPLTGTGSLRVEAGKQVFNNSGLPLSHQGSTTVNGILDTTNPANSIDNNAALVIGPSGQFSTGTGQVGSLAGSGLLHLQSGLLTVGGDNTSTTYSGQLTGPGDFRKTGAGTLTVASATWFGGGVTIEAPGALRLGNGTTGPSTVAAIGVDGTIFFNTPSIAVSGNISGSGNVTVQSGSTVTLGSPLPMTHAGTTIISGQLNSPAVAAIDNNSTLLLSGGLTTRGGNVGSLSGSGTLQLNSGGGAFTTGGNNAATAFAGVLSGSGALGKVGNGTFTLSGASPGFAGGVTVSSGTLHVSGILGTSGITVVTGANLTGTGTINGPVNVEIGANLAPGPTVGTFATGNLALAGNLLIEIQGPTAGTQYDRVNANGAVAINGAALTLSGAYTPIAGNAFTIIQNDGVDPVTGTFAGLPEGATLTFNGATLRITYAGGTGNDVVLAPASVTVTPSAGAGGTISPNVAQVVAPNATVAFTVTANPGYSASVGGTCGGNLAGATYTTNPVTVDCTVVASFTLTGHIVTPSAGPNGTIAPNAPQTVATGGTASFTVTPDAGFAATVGGTCGGTLVGNTFTTSPVTANCTVSVTFEFVNPPRLANISTRVQVLTGDDVLIGGFVIGGSTNKTVAVVAYGPSLAAFGIANPLANPTLTLVRSSDQAVIATNNDWQSASNASQLQAAGLAPSDALEPAILVNLAPGAYTAILQGVGGGTGIGTVAVFEVDAVITPLINISTRGRVQTGNEVMIGGFVIQGQGTQTVAIVGTGPSLGAFGIASPLANPTLTLVRSSDQAVLATNDDWQAGPNAAQLQAAGFAPSNALESAIYVTLPPGAYTAILSGVGNTSGVGVIGVYKVP